MGVEPGVLGYENVVVITVRERFLDSEVTHWKYVREIGFDVNLVHRVVDANFVVVGVREVHVFQDAIQQVGHVEEPWR